MNNPETLPRVFDETALNLSNALPEPDGWGDWLLYLLEALDAQAQEKGRQEEFAAMLSQVREHLQTRVDRGSWWAAV